MRCHIICDENGFGEPRKIRSRGGGDGWPVELEGTSQMISAVNLIEHTLIHKNLCHIIKLDNVQKC